MLAFELSPLLTLPTQYHPWVVLAVFIWIVISLFFNYLKPSLLFLSGCLLLVILGVIPIELLLSSISNKSILTIMLLILITSAIRRNFKLEDAMDRVFKGVIRPKQFMVRMMALVSICSAFFNNTPIVHLMTPYVYDWSKKVGSHPSKLLIPLSFATILGGMITTIGTSTNIVLNGFIEKSGLEPLSITDFAPLGLILVAMGILYFYVWGYALLPINKTAFSNVKAIAPEYLVATVINPGSVLIGKKIKDTTLQSFNGAYLIEIHRLGEVQEVIDPEFELLANDQLMFMGKTDNILALVHSEIGLDLPNHKEEEIIEAVIPTNSYLEGKTIGEVDFYKTYNANLLAIHRKGQQLNGALHEQYLESGDLLLLSVNENFNSNHESISEFYILSKLDNDKIVPAKKIRLSLLLIVTVILLMVTSLITTFFGVLLISSGLSILGLMSKREALKDLDFDLMLLLVGALTFGNAMISSGASDYISASVIVLFLPFGSIAVLIGVFILTVMLTSFVTNVAAVSIMFPLAFSLAQSMGINGQPLFMAIAFGASAAFLTPVSYQTNWMVYGPGGYKPQDYLKVGMPLIVLYTFFTLAYILVVYPFKV